MLKKDNKYLLYQENFRFECGKRFSGVVESYVRFIEKQRASRINKLFSRGSILDIGCGRGIFLSEMKRLGWQVLGSEVFLGAKRISEELNIPVEIGDLNEIKLDAETFDIVTLWHVLEHVEELSILQNIRRVLKKGGILIISVPNINSLQSRFFKEKWIHYNTPFHVHHFSPDSLSSLLNSYGFSPYRVKYTCFTYNFFGWLEGFVDILLKKQNIFLENIGSNNRIYPMTYFLTMILSIPALLAVFIEILLRRGGTFELYAKKD